MWLFLGFKTLVFCCANIFIAFLPYLAPFLAVYFQYYSWVNTNSRFSVGLFLISYMILSFNWSRHFIWLFVAPPRTFKIDFKSHVRTLVWMIFSTLIFSFMFFVEINGLLWLLNTIIINLLIWYPIEFYCLYSDIDEVKVMYMNTLHYLLFSNEPNFRDMYSVNVEVVNPISIVPKITDNSSNV